MSRSALTVETRQQAVLIFGEEPDLIPELAKELSREGLHAQAIHSTAEIGSIVESFDPDYLVVFPGATDDVLKKLEELALTYSSRVFLLAQNKLPQGPLDHLRPTRIIYSDYLDENLGGSKLLSSWISSLQIGEGIVIPGDGLATISLLAKPDLIELLKKAILLPKTRGQTLYLGSPEPISFLNLAYLFRRNLSQKLSLSFDPGLDAGDSPLIKSKITESLDILNFQPELKLEPLLSQGLAKLSLKNISQAPTPKAPRPVPKLESQAEPSHQTAKKLSPLRLDPPQFVPVKPKKATLKKTARPWRASLIIGRGVLIGLTLYLTTIAFAATVFYLSLKNFATSLNALSLPSPSSFSHFATTYLQANWSLLSAFPGLKNSTKVKEVTTLLNAYSEAQNSVKTAEKLAIATEAMLAYIFGNGDQDIAQSISKSRLHAESLYQELSLIDGALPSTAPSVIPKKYQSKYLDFKERLGEIKRTALATKGILATTPEIIGLGGRKKYAVLFQNNAEIRATGGFIGSFAIMNFENGKLYDLPIYDVYDADGQLKGHVEPPPPIKDILGEANWYLRDSNFDPDFPGSARRAEWFIKKSLNLDLDGTVAVNVFTLEDILSAIGPLQIPDYNETISAENLYERAQYHAEVNFFPGSTQKKEFLSTIASTLFAKLPSLTAEEGLRLASALSSSIDQKNALVSVLNPGATSILEKLGWTGEVLDPVCPSEGLCYQDYTMVVDSNFGVNKANYYVTRRVEQVITLDKDLGVNHTLRLTYHNASTSNSWPAGDYKNYQRIYLPEGTAISELKVNGVALSSSEFELFAEHGKTVVAHLVTTKTSETTTIELMYKTPGVTKEGSPTYSWYWQKQPGTGEGDPITVYLNYPLYLNPEVVSPRAEVAPQQLKFELKNTSDRRATVQFSE